MECIGSILEYQSDIRGYKTPVVEFTTLKGELVKEKPYFYASTDLSKVRSYKNNINKQVSVLYDAEEPKKFVLAIENGFNYSALLLGMIVSLVFIVFSICCLLGYIDLGQ